MTFDKEHDVRKRHHIFGSFTDAAGYDRHAWGALTRLRERIVTDVATAGLPSGSRVLDVGTGPGRLPLAIAARLPHLRVDAVDLEPRMIEYARSRPDAARVTFTVGDVAHLPFPDDTFDLVVSSLSQHHWSDVPGGLRDLRRVLRPGGRLWIYDVRFSLRRATALARATFPPASVTRETRPLRLVARLVATRS